MALEIERKYVLPVFPHELIKQATIQVVTVHEIEQTYLAYSRNEEFRIRAIRSDTTTMYTHTYKKGNGLSREEIEIEIERETYEQLLKQSAMMPLRKKRTRILDNDQAIDIDEYEQFELITAEVEFDDEQTAFQFQAPAWFGREVGAEHEYRNKKLWIEVNQRSKR